MHDRVLTARRSKLAWVYEMAASRFYLCPAGSGVQTTRFFETLYVGKVPVRIDLDWLPPFANLINYTAFR